MTVLLFCEYGAKAYSIVDIICPAGSLFHQRETERTVSDLNVICVHVGWANQTCRRFLRRLCCQRATLRDAERHVHSRPLFVADKL